MTTPELSPADEVRRLLAASRGDAAQGRALLDRSIATRRAALDAVPAGMILEFRYPRDAATVMMSVRRTLDGPWEQQDDPSTPWRPIVADWVEEQWMWGNLRIREESDHA